MGVVVLRLRAGQVLSLWDEVLPIEVRELPEDLTGWAILSYNLDTYHHYAT